MRKRSRHPCARPALLTAVVLLVPLAAIGSEEGADEPDDLSRSKSDAELRSALPPSLSSVPVREPDNLGEFVRDRSAAIALGKALFWDMRVGSQGQACASCHFQAGADPRVRNQLSPGLLADDTTFDATGSGGVGGPNYLLRRDDFPFHRKVDPEKNDEEDGNTLFDTNDVASSQGVRLARFLWLARDGGTPWNWANVDDEMTPDAVFKVGAVTVRRVEPRNTPTVLNAARSMRNFWDGRANFIFNGLDPFGQRSNAEHPDQGLWRLRDDGVLEKVQVEIPFSSAASQAVGPPLNAFEMSSADKPFPLLARLLLRHYALSLQAVHREDSALASLRHPTRSGLVVHYKSLVRRAFQPRWWMYTGDITTPDGGFKQEELNFSLFFGLAIQMYEATLDTTRSALADFQAGGDSALSESQKFGLEVFLNQGRCINCHGGPTFSGASVPELFSGLSEGEQAVERMPMAQGVAVYDAGFYNIGVRPTTDDLGVGGLDPFGNPLSFSKQLSDGNLVDRFLSIDPDRFEEEPGEPVRLGERTAVRGAFKTPSLLNVALTAPFMHNGGMLTLEQVVDFYARGGDFHRRNIDDLDPDIEGIRKIRGKPLRIRAVADFLRALTDPRVVDESGPFDHPSLVVVEGNVGDETACTTEEVLVTIPAVGRRGRRAYGLTPIRPFLE